MIEPATPVPVVVTWATEFRTSATDFVFGISVNGGTCTAYGPRTLGAYAPSDGTGDLRTFHWVISPSAGLVKGKNTLTPCGGELSNNTNTVELGIRSLSAQISK